MLDALASLTSARLISGALLAGVFGLAARRAGALTGSGAAAATIVGAAAWAAGWRWAALLIAWFVATTALTRFGAARKQAATREVVEKGGTRDWRQVLANGGVFAVGALAAAGGAGPPFAALAFGALAAAAADSWGTEIGTLARRAPRSILTLRAVPPGTSGGVSAPGLAASLAGGAFIGTLVWLLGWSPRLGAGVAVAGLAGALADSLLGAALQARRWCPRCAVATEQVHHRCGSPTTAAGGLQWLDNDGVNLAATLIGGLLAVPFVR